MIGGRAVISPTVINCPVMTKAEEFGPGELEECKIDQKISLSGLVGDIISIRDLSFS
jgi:hypothetical protein